MNSTSWHHHLSWVVAVDSAVGWSVVVILQHAHIACTLDQLTPVMLRQYDMQAFIHYSITKAGFQYLMCSSTPFSPPANAVSVI